MRKELRIPSGSCAVAIRRSPPPRCEHFSTSIANARCIRAARLQAREALVAFVPPDVAIELVIRTGATAVGPGARARTRRRGGASRRARQTDRGKISRFASGCGVIAARRSNNASGSNIKSRVPSRHAVLQVQRDAPVSPQPQPLLRERRSQGVAGKPLRPAQSRANSHTLACRSTPSRCACRAPRDVTASAAPLALKPQHAGLEHAAPEEFPELSLHELR